jgi:hypothetical protein
VGGVRHLPLLLAAAALAALPVAADAAGPGPVRVIGGGDPARCTSEAVVRAVARGGTVRFDCGPSPVVIRMRRTARVMNTSREVVIDGGGRVTLDGGGARRIVHQDTCDRRLVWTTDHCDDQATPRLTLRDIALVRGDATGLPGGGGGAVYARGGRLTITRVVFRDNRCDPSGPDVAGAAVRALDQYRDLPVRVTGSTFTGGRCANGGALGGIGVSWAITGGEFRGNRATGRGANPARPGTPGGGSGGALYMDGNRITLTLRRTLMLGNLAREGGGAIFFVSNDRTGTATLAASVLRGNRSLGFETPGLPGVFHLGAGRPRVVEGTTITR